MTKAIVEVKTKNEYYSVFQDGKEYNILDIRPIQIIEVVNMEK